VLRLRSYQRISVQNWWFRSNGGWLTQNFRQQGVAPINHSFSQKTKLNDFSYGIKIWTNLSSVLVTIHAFDRQADTLTDGRTYRILIARLRLHSTQCSKKHRPHFSVIFLRNAKQLKIMPALKTNLRQNS